MTRSKLTPMDRIDIRAAVRTRESVSNHALQIKYGYGRTTIAVIANLDPQVFFAIREATKLRRELSAKALAKKHGCSPGTINQIASYELRGDE